MSYLEPCVELEEQCTTPRPLKHRKVATPLLLSITACRLLLLKMFPCGGSAATRDKQYRLLIKLAQAAPSPAMDSIGEISQPLP